MLTVTGRTRQITNMAITVVPRVYFWDATSAILASALRFLCWMASFLASTSSRVRFPANRLTALNDTLGSISNPSNETTSGSISRKRNSTKKGPAHPVPCLIPASRRTNASSKSLTSRHGKRTLGINALISYRSRCEVLCLFLAYFCQRAEHVQKQRSWSILELSHKIIQEELRSAALGSYRCLTFTHFFSEDAPPWTQEGTFVKVSLSDMLCQTSLPFWHRWKNPSRRVGYPDLLSLFLLLVAEEAEEAEKIASLEV